MTIRREDLDYGRVDLSGVIDSRRAPMKPVHPGAILKHEFLDPLGVTAYRLAKDINVPINRVAAIVGGRRAITADTALRLGQWLGTGPELWLNLQKAYELDLARQKIGGQLEAIRPYQRAGIDSNAVFAGQ